MPPTIIPIKDCQYSGNIPSIVVMSRVGFHSTIAFHGPRLSLVSPGLYCTAPPSPHGPLLVYCATVRPWALTATSAPPCACLDNVPRKKGMQRCLTWSSSPAYRCHGSASCPRITCKVRRAIQKKESVSDLLFGGLAWRSLIKKLAASTLQTESGAFCAILFYKARSNGNMPRASEVTRSWVVMHLQT